MRLFRLIALLLVTTAGSASAQVVATPPPIQRENSSQPATEHQPPPATAQSSSPLLGKWYASFYGFVELDGMQDSTQSFNDLASNQALARPGTFEGQHARNTASVRNTRLGFKLTTPEYHRMQASGILETDFFGNEPSVASSSEGSFFTSPVLRIRHAFLKLQTPYVDLLMGQSWQVFGWQPYFHPNTVDLQGVPGQVYSRTPQIRLSHLFHTTPADVEVAAAAARPVQRDSGVPDGQAGLRVAANDWKGLHTLGGAVTTLDSAMVGVSGVVRRFQLGAPGTTGATANAELSPGINHSATGWGVSVDGFIPIIPASATARGNSLSLNGSWVRGAGVADMYTGLSFGVPSVSAGSNVDPGLVVQQGSGALDAVESRSWLLGAQYYLPGAGNVWVAGNYSRVDFLNYGVILPTSRSKIFKHSDWFDVNVFWDITPAVRLGGEYARFEQTYVDGVNAYDNRWQISGWYLF